MRRALFVLALILAAPALTQNARADEFSDNMAGHLNAPALDALARDVGALMGGSSFHHGRALGFPLGVDIGFHVPVVGIRDDNAILRDNGRTAHALWGQLEYGLPGRMNLIARVGELYAADLVGGGLRWGLFSSSKPGLPSISVAALYGRIRHDVFAGETLTANVVASFEVPFIHPYIGAGYDRTTLDVDGNAADGKADGVRVEAGVNLSVIPFTYLTLGGGVANGRSLAHAGLGMRF